MRRLGMLTATTASVLILGGALPASDAVAQQKSLKEQLVGTWIYVSSTSTRRMAVTADELKFTNPRTPAVEILEFVWKLAEVGAALATINDLHETGGRGADIELRMHR